MKQHAKEKTVPPPRRDDKMVRKESTFSALLGSFIRMLEMAIAGGVLAIFFPSTKSILTDGQLAWTMIESLVICSLLVSIRSRL